MSDSQLLEPDLPNERLDAYLDGLMSPEEQQAFEQEMSDNQQLRRECELQREIDASMGRLFVAPEPPDILAMAGEAVNELPKREQISTNTNRRALFAVLAACVAWAIVGWKFFLQNNDDGYREVALAEIYEQCVDKGFRPKWVCEDDREFAETFQRRQGQPLLLKPEAKHTMVGLSYLKGITANTTTMLARVDGEPVLVFVETLKRDTKPAQPSWGSGLNMFRHELDGLVLYEVTPLDEPRVLSSFYIPDLSELPPHEVTEKPESD